MSGNFFERLHIRLLPIYVLVEIYGLSERLINIFRGSSKLIPIVPAVAGYVGISYVCLRAQKYGRFWRNGTRALLLLATIGLIVTIIPPRVVSSGRALLIADVENATGNPGFPAAAVKKAFAIALDQSKTIGVFPQDRAEDILREMGRSPKEKITVDVGREICVHATSGRWWCLQ